MLIIIGLINSCYLHCSKSRKVNNHNFPINTQNEYLPLQIGNYWKIDDNNYRKIIDTVYIENKKYYKFSIITGGDVESIRYLRINKSNMLLEAFPNKPGYIYTEAQFNKQKGEIFFTSHDTCVNNKKVTVINKNNSIIRFRYDLLAPNNGSYTVTYKKGIGWCDNYKQIKINNLKK